MNIASALLNGIKDRQLDYWFQLEENVGRQTKPQILEAINDPERKAEDKLRTFIIFFLTVENVSKEDMMEYEAALLKAGISLAALNYVKRYGFVLFLLFLFLYFAFYLFPSYFVLFPTISHYFYLSPLLSCLVLSCTFGTTLDFFGLFSYYPLLFVISSVFIPFFL